MTAKLPAVIALICCLEPWGALGPAPAAPACGGARDPAAAGSAPLAVCGYETQDGNAHALTLWRAPLAPTPSPAEARKWEHRHRKSFPNTVIRLTDAELLRSGEGRVLWSSDVYLPEPGKSPGPIFGAVVWHPELKKPCVAVALRGTSSWRIELYVVEVAPIPARPASQAIGSHDWPEPASPVGVWPAGPPGKGAAPALPATVAGLTLLSAIDTPTLLVYALPGGRGAPSFLEFSVSDRRWAPVQVAIGEVRVVQPQPQWPFK